MQKLNLEFTADDIAETTDFNAIEDKIEEISTYLGKNIIDFENITFTNGNGATTTRDGGTYTVTCATNEWGLCQFHQNHLQLEPNTTYTFSAKVVSTEAPNGSFVLVGPYLSADGQLFGNYAQAGERSSVTFTTPNVMDTSQTGCRVGLYPRKSNATAVFTDIQLEEGSTATEYRPYISYTKHTWSVKDFLLYTYLNNIEQGIKNIGKAYFRPYGWQDSKTWYPQMGFSYQDMNRWVNNLNLIVDRINNESNSLFPSDTLYPSEDLLPH